MCDDTAQGTVSDGGAGPPLKRGRRGSALAIGLLIAVWLLAILFRMEIRAYWWAYRLAGADSPEAKHYYVACLASIGDKALIVIPRLLASPQAPVRVAGIQILRYCPSQRARQLLLAAVPDDSDAVVDQAALGLALRPDRDEALPSLRAMLQSASPRAARSAAVAIQRIAGPQAQAILLGQLAAADDPEVLAQIMDSLGLLACRPAISMLIARLGDERPLSLVPASQRQAERALAMVQGQLIAKGIDPHQAIQAGRGTLTVASVASRALRMITGISFGDPATQPAAGARAIRQQWEVWSRAWNPGN